MAPISWGGRLGSRFAGADGDSVVDALKERCGILALLIRFGSQRQRKTYVRKERPP